MNDYSQSRRDFLINSGLTMSGLLLFGSAVYGKAASSIAPGQLKISLAEWSLHKMLFAEELTNLDFAAKARSFGIDAIEYVSAFFNGNVSNTQYLQDLNSRADDNGVKQLLIMVDGEGPLAAASEKKRSKAVDDHKKWVEAAGELGCHSIRVNLNGDGNMEEMGGYGADGLGALAAFAADHNINIMVENHGGPSSNAAWLAEVMKSVGMDNCGTLPDFGNFCIERTKRSDGSWDCIDEYDRYKGMEELLPYAKAVSAKSYDFDDSGMETTIDYKRMIDLVKASGYSGYIGVEYEGSRLDEEAGVIATKNLLERYI